MPFETISVHVIVRSLSTDNDEFIAGRDASPPLARRQLALWRKRSIEKATGECSSFFLYFSTKYYALAYNTKYVEIVITIFILTSILHWKIFAMLNLIAC